MDVQACGGPCQVAADGSSGECLSLTGSCLGRCGTDSLPGQCSCAADCVTKGNCCADYYDWQCEKVTYCAQVPAWSCQNFCGGYNDVGGCYCDTFCFGAKDCCPDVYACGCAAP